MRINLRAAAVVAVVVVVVGPAMLVPLATAQAPQKPPVPTFTEHVAPIVWKSCTPCHRPGEVAPFALLSYADVKKRGRNILQAVEDRYMPPWHPEPGYGAFRNDVRLSDEQVGIIKQWVGGGMPEGPPEQLPKLPEFTTGWQLGEPDLIVKTSARSRRAGEAMPIRGAAGGGGVAADGAGRRADCVFAEEAVEGRHDGGGDDEGRADGASVCAGAKAAQTSSDLSRGAGTGGGIAFTGGAQA